VTLVPYFPLPDAIIRQIVGMQLERIRARLLDTYRATFEWEPELVDRIAARCTEGSSGARNVENILTRTLLPELSAEVLARLADGESIRNVHAAVKPDGLFFFTINRPQSC
jgi:type VI secretion system protein VasG